MELVTVVLVIGIFALALPSAVDLGIYAYRMMQVRNSAQMGVQAIWAACTQLPATDSSACSTASTALTQAVQRTSLGSRVTVTDVKEGYYCTDSSGALANAASSGNTGDFGAGNSLSATVPNPPTDCTAITSPQTATPGDYIWVTVSYNFSPLFPRISLASLLGTQIQSTAWLRLL